MNNDEEIFVEAEIETNSSRYLTAIYCEKHTLERLGKILHENPKLASIKVSRLLPRKLGETDPVKHKKMIDLQRDGNNRCNQCKEKPAFALQWTNMKEA